MVQAPYHHPSPKAILDTFYKAAVFVILAEMTVSTDEGCEKRPFVGAAPFKAPI
jgi:hypothetical protein